MRPTPFFSRSDRRALLLLEWAVVLILLGIWIWTWRHPSSQEHREVHRDSTAYSRPSSPSYAVEEKWEAFPFDPNTADSTALLRLGLAPWQVRAIYRYRAKHGRYHTPEEFRRLPGMTQEVWDHLSPYIQIDSKFRYLEPAPVHKTALSPSSVSSSDTSSATIPLPTTSSAVADSAVSEKYSEGTLVDLATADTFQLKRIPGIASYRARKIVEYRSRLGGFVNVEQVMEACQLPDEVLPWFTLSSVDPERVNVNNASVQRLMRHPYLTFYQAKALVEYRNEHGPLCQLSDLQHISGFSASQIERLSPYLDFK